jgi:N-acetylneuraminate synthase
MEKQSITIDGKKFNIDHTFITAEVAMAHDGSLGSAHAYIDSIASTGVDAVKFQTHIASAESSLEEKFRVNFSKQDTSRFEYWKRTEFTEEQWKELKAHADNRGLIFLSSPFSFEAVELLKRVGVSAWKVAAGETLNPIFLNFLVDTNLPILISTGMSYCSELESIVSYLRKSDAEHLLYHCTSIYPTPPEKWGLNNVKEFQKRFQCPVGLSDHSGTIFPSFIAVWDGAIAVEVHVVFNRDIFGPDVPASITIEELKVLVKGIRMLDTARRYPSSKDEIANSLGDMRRLFGKSVVASQFIGAGTNLGKEHVCFRKPGIGITSEHLERILGKKLKKDIEEGEFLKHEYFE